MDYSVGNSCRLCLVGIHILPILMKARKVRSELAEIVHHFLFFFVCNKFRQMLLYQFFLEQIPVRTTFFESLHYLLAQGLLYLVKVYLVTVWTPANST